MTTYFCIRCKKPLEVTARYKWGKGGVCKECYEILGPLKPLPEKKNTYWAGGQKQDWQWQNDHLKQTAQEKV